MRLLFTILIFLFLAGCDYFELSTTPHPCKEDLANCPPEVIAAECGGENPDLECEAYCARDAKPEGCPVPDSGTYTVGGDGGSSGGEEAQDGGMDASPSDAGDAGIDAGDAGGDAGDAGSDAENVCVCG